MKNILLINIIFILISCKTIEIPVYKYSNEKADIYLSNGKYKIVTKSETYFPYSAKSSGSYTENNDTIIFNSYLGLYRVDYVVDSVKNNGVIGFVNEADYTCETFQFLSLIINTDTLNLDCTQGGFDYSKIEIFEINTLNYYSYSDNRLSEPTEVSKDELLNINICYKLSSYKSNYHIELDNIKFVKDDNVLRFVSGDYYNEINKDSLSFILDDYKFMDSSLPYDRFGWIK